MQTNEDHLKDDDDLQNEDNLKNEDDLKNEDKLKIEDVLRNEDDSKNKDNLKNDDDIKNKDNLNLKFVPGPSLHTLFVIDFFWKWFCSWSLPLDDRIQLVYSCQQCLMEKWIENY